jgi:hypothetical protein
MGVIKSCFDSAVDVAISPPPLPPPTRTDLFTMFAGDHDPSKVSNGSEFGTDKVDFVESNNGSPEHALQRQLKNRHIAMIRYFPTFLPVVPRDSPSGCRLFWVGTVLGVSGHLEAMLLMVD